MVWSYNRLELKWSDGWIHLCETDRSSEYAVSRAHFLDSFHVPAHKVIGKYPTTQQVYEVVCVRARACVRMRGIQKVRAIYYFLYSTEGTQEQIYCHFLKMASPCICYFSPQASWCQMRRMFLVVREATHASCPWPHHHLQISIYVMHWASPSQYCCKNCTHFHKCPYVLICKLHPPCTNIAITEVLVDDGICRSKADVQLFTYYQWQ
jgi:hypothetical protein